MNAKRLRVVGLLCCGLAAPAGFGQQLFWTDGNLFAIKRAALDGSEMAVVAEGRNYSYLAFDPVTRLLYYSVADPVPALWSSRPDGTEQTLLRTFDTHNFLRGMAIDAVGGKIYWSSSDGYVAGNGKIRRANLDASDVEDLVSDMVYPYGMALDMAGGKMFWIRQESDSIWRANLDGSEPESLISLGTGSYAFCLALDTARGRLYWTDAGRGGISRANLDGTGVEQIAALDRSSLDAGITVDPGPEGQWRSIGTRPLVAGSGGDGSAALFWADTINHKVYASALDGAGAHVFREGEPNYAQSLLVIRNWEIAVRAARAAQGTSLGWNSRAGRVYRVFANSGPNDSWSDISGRLVAAGPTTSWTDASAGSVRMRLYRVVME